MRILARTLGAAVALVLAVTACSSGTDGDRAAVTTVASTTTSAPAALVGPDAFAARMDEPGVVTINVHVPDDGHIEGTDLTVAFDEISTSTELPGDKATPLAVYCRSGNMSASAVRDLAALGYTDVVELEGGFDAWAASGRPLQPPGS